MASIRLIFTDMDGTLLGRGGILSEYNANVLRRASDKGAIVCMASGRPYWQILPHLVHLGFNTPVVACNGAYVYDPATDEFLRKMLMPVDQTMKALSFLDEHGIDWSLYGHYTLGSPTPRSVFANHRGEDDNLEEEFGAIGRVPPAHTILRTQEDYINELNKGIGKISAIGTLEALDELAEFFEKENFPGIQMHKTGSVVRDIVPTGTSKWEGIEMLAKRFGVSLDEVCVFGDNMNDFEMIKKCKTSFVVSNGDERIFPYATHVIDSNINDGVGKAIEEYIMDNIVK